MRSIENTAAANGHATAEPLPPHNREAERRLLGTILAHNRGLDEVLQVLGGAEAFYVFGHRRIFDALVELITHGKPADVITVSELLKTRGHLDEAGGYAYLVGLWDERDGSAAQLAAHAEIVRGRHVVRRVIHAATEIQRAAWSGAGADEVLEGSQRWLLELTGLAAPGELVGQEAAVREYLAALDREGGAEGTPVLTGWRQLDAVTGGFCPGELVLVGARPGGGKSAFLVNLTVRVARRGEEVLFLTLEMSRLEQVGRQVALRSGLGGWRLRQRAFNPGERESILAAAEDLARLPIVYDDHPDQTLARIGADVRRRKAAGTLRLVVLDYVQMIQGGGPREARHEVVGSFSRYLKLLARQAEVPVVAAAQVNRESEGRADRRPRLADLRESGSLEADADTVLLLHKPEDADAARAVDLLEVEVAKNRSGPTDRLTLAHRKALFEVCDLEPGGTP
jgi:replicative DNA helicase